MTCNKCNQEAIENQANGNKFWFCQTCRVEVTPHVDDSEELGDYSWIIQPPDYSPTHTPQDCTYYTIDLIKDPNSHIIAYFNRLREELKKTLKEGK